MFQVSYAVSMKTASPPSYATGLTVAEIVRAERTSSRESVLFSRFKISVFRCCSVARTSSEMSIISSGMPHRWRTALRTRAAPATIRCELLPVIIAPSGSSMAMATTF